MIGESEAKDETEQALWMLETNVDDVSPQIIGHVMDRAFTLGARDCYFTPIQMKKNRPGVLLSILCDPEKKTEMTDLLFTETTTIGVRSYQVNRRALDRQIVRVETLYGPIDVKVARLNGRVVNAMPEFDQCRQAAELKGVALKEVEDAARLAFRMSVKKSEVGRVIL